MKPIRLVYAPLKNAGDSFNVELIEELSERKVICSKVYNADMMAIGGALFGVQYSNGFKRKALQKIMHLLYEKKPLYVWGSGFIINSNNNPLYRNNLVVCALRGEKTKEKLSSLTGKTYDVPLADAGLLVDRLLEHREAPRYQMGIIPHLSQQSEEPFVKLASQEGHHMIDITKTAKEVIEEIAQCETIASSSLHGLIFADSLHIPSLHLLGKTELLGGTFKFEDYYSSFGVEDNPWMIYDSLPTKDDIIARYQIDPAKVEEKKEQLIKVFPKF